MKIWIVNHYAIPPSSPGGTRHYSLARYMTAAGHDVLLVTASFDHFSRKQLLGGAEKSREGQIDGVSFLWLKSGEYSALGGRYRSMLEFSWRVLAAGKKFPRPDVVVGSSPHPFAALAASSIARAWGVPFVLEVRDIWPDSVVQLAGFSQSHPGVALLRSVEKQLYKRATRIITLLPGAAQHFAQFGYPSKHVCYIPNGIDLSLVPQVTEPSPANGLRVVYAGSMGPPNALDTLLEAAIHLDQKQASIGFRLVGDGPDRPQLERKAQDLANVVFEQPVAKARIHALLSEADVCLLLMKGTALYKHGFSMNKLWDYMAVARPVVVGTNVAENPISESGGGMAVPSDNPLALAGALLDMQKAGIEVRQAMGKRARQWVEEHRDMRRLAAEFVELLAQVVRN